MAPGGLLGATHFPEPREDRQQTEVNFQTYRFHMSCFLFLKLDTEGFEVIGEVTACVGLSLSMLDTNTPYGAVVPREVLRPLGTGTLTKVRDRSSRPGASRNSGNITWALFTELHGQAAFRVTARDLMTFFLPSETVVWTLPRRTSLCPHMEVHCD